MLVVDGLGHLVAVAELLRELPRGGSGGTVHVGEVLPSERCVARAAAHTRHVVGARRDSSLCEAPFLAVIGDAAYAPRAVAQAALVAVTAPRARDVQQRDVLHPEDLRGVRPRVDIPPQPVH